jgi:hypothetical protein
MTPTEDNGKTFDCWHLPEQTDEEMVQEREERAAFLAQGPSVLYPEGPAEYPPPARTPAHLLAIPRCKLTGRLLDPEPPVKGESREERLDRMDRNFEARVKDDELFKPTPRWPKLRKQLLTQLVIDLQFPPGSGEPEWVVRVAGHGGEDFSPQIIPAAHADEAGRRYMKVMGITGFDPPYKGHNPHIEAVPFIPPPHEGNGEAETP